MMFVANVPSEFIEDWALNQYHEKAIQEKEYTFCKGLKVKIASCPEDADLSIVTTTITTITTKYPTTITTEYLIPNNEIYSQILWILNDKESYWFECKSPVFNIRKDEDGYTLFIIGHEPPVPEKQIYREEKYEVLISIRTKSFNICGKGNVLPLVADYGSHLILQSHHGHTFKISKEYCRRWN